MNGALTAPSMDDTIVAIATPPGHGGVAVARLSGPLAIPTLKRAFRESSGRREVEAFAPRLMRHGLIVDGQHRRVDEVLAVVFPGPHSFTGEDVAEVHCHGGPMVTAAVLETLLAAGKAVAATGGEGGVVRHARPGEFSKRAYMHGKVDLAQAEAIAEAIAADSPAGLALAQTRLSGALSRRVGDLREHLEELRRRLCVAVDFPEEEVECLPPESLAGGVRDVLALLEGLLEAASRRRVWEEGALVVLAGRVNAGKSSLLNALAGRERAIVTATPGATRDYLEERLILEGLPITLVDTAGLRDDGVVLLDDARPEREHPASATSSVVSLDPVEVEGMRRSWELVRRADLVCLVLDAGAATPFGPAEAELFASLPPAGRVVVWNKADRRALDEATRAELETAMGCAAATVATVVRRDGETQGVEALAAAIRTALTHADEAPGPGELAPNQRQAQAIHAAAAELAGLLDDIAAGAPYDVLGVRLELASSLLAEITGAIASQDVLNSVFDRFCIGK